MNEPPHENEPTPRQAPLQFSLRSMLVVTAAFGLVFGVLRWIGAPPQVSLLVLVLLAVSVIAAIGLVVVIAGSERRSGADPRDSERPPEDTDGPHHRS